VATFKDENPNNYLFTFGPEEDRMGSALLNNYLWWT